MLGSRSPVVSSACCDRERIEKIDCDSLDSECIQVEVDSDQENETDNAHDNESEFENMDSPQFTLTRQPSSTSLEIHMDEHETQNNIAVGERVDNNEYSSLLGVREREYSSCDLELGNNHDTNRRRPRVGSMTSVGSKVNLNLSHLNNISIGHQLTRSRAASECEEECCFICLQSVRAQNGDSNYAVELDSVSELEAITLSHGLSLTLTQEERVKAAQIWREVNDEVTHLPCENPICQEKIVHSKCIYEWFNASTGYDIERDHGNNSSSIKPKSTCPLCRGNLSDSFEYIPNDELNSHAFCDKNIRTQFLLNPVPKEIGTVRFYMKLSKRNMLHTKEKTIAERRPHYDVNNAYEIYLQRPTTLPYPYGPVPDSSFPIKGDKKLVSVNRIDLRNRVKDRLSNVPKFRLDMILTDSNYESPVGEEGSPNFKDTYLGSVYSSYKGCRHQILVGSKTHVAAFPAVNPPNRSNPEALAASLFQKEMGADKPPTPPQYAPPLDNNPNRTRLDEVGCVHFLPNLKDGKSIAGPKRIAVALPRRLIETAPLNNPLKCVQNDKNQFEPSIAPISICPKDSVDNSIPPAIGADLLPIESKTVNQALQMIQVAQGPSNALAMKNMNSSITGLLSQQFVFGENREPYWLEAVEAYSLDFRGRVTLPSNKNFQLLLDPENPAPDSAAKPAGNDADEDNKHVGLQFGKVGEDADCEVFSMDFKWPFSPVQAFGICLSACDRNSFPPR